MPGAFAYKTSLVIMFPRGIYCWVAKPGAIWDSPDVDVDSTMCQVSEIAVYSYLGWFGFFFPLAGGWRVAHFTILPQNALSSLIGW